MSMNLNSLESHTAHQDSINLVNVLTPEEYLELQMQKQMLGVGDGDGDGKQTTALELKSLKQFASELFSPSDQCNLPLQQPNKSRINPKVTISANEEAYREEGLATRYSTHNTDNKAHDSATSSAAMRLLVPQSKSRPAPKTQKREERARGKENEHSRRQTTAVKQQHNPHNNKQPSQSQPNCKEFADKSLMQTKDPKTSFARPTKSSAAKTAFQTTPQTTSQTTSQRVDKESRNEHWAGTREKGPQRRRALTIKRSSNTSMDSGSRALAQVTRVQKQCEEAITRSSQIKAYDSYINDSLLELLEEKIEQDSLRLQEKRKADLSSHSCNYSLAMAMKRAEAYVGKETLAARVRNAMQKCSEGQSSRRSLAPIKPFPIARKVQEDAERSRQPQEKLADACSFAATKCIQSRPSEEAASKSSFLIADPAPHQSQNSVVDLPKPLADLSHISSVEPSSAFIDNLSFIDPAQGALEDEREGPCPHGYRNENAGTDVQFADDRTKAQCTKGQHKDSNMHHSQKKKKESREERECESKCKSEDQGSIVHQSTQGIRKAEGNGNENGYKDADADADAETMAIGHRMCTTRKDNEQEEQIDNDYPEARDSKAEPQNERNSPHNNPDEWVDRSGVEHEASDIEKTRHRCVKQEIGNVNQDEQEGSDESNILPDIIDEYSVSPPQQETHSAMLPCLCDNHTDEAIPQATTAPVKTAQVKEGENPSSSAASVSASASASVGDCGQTQGTEENTCEQDMEAEVREEGEATVGEVKDSIHACHPACSYDCLPAQDKERDEMQNKQRLETMQCSYDDEALLKNEGKSSEYLTQLTKIDRKYKQIFGRLKEEKMSSLQFVARKYFDENDNQKHTSGHKAQEILRRYRVILADYKSTKQLIKQQKLLESNEILAKYRQFHKVLHKPI